MTEGTTPAASLGYAECVARLEAAREAAAALPSLTWQASGADLATGMETLGELTAACEAAEVAITRDAIERGEPGCATPPQSPREWVMAHHRRYAVAGACRLVAVADACRDPRNAILTDAVLSGRVSITAAQVALTEMRLLRPHLNPDNPDAVDTVWRALMTLGECHDTRTVRQLRERLLAAHGRDAFDDSEDRARDGAALSPGRQIAPGTYEYLLRVTREGRALLEAAIGPGSAPVPGPDGEADPRPHTQRRAEALIAVVSRALKAGDSTWSSTKAQVFVAIALADLQNHQTQHGGARAASSSAGDGSSCASVHNTASGSATGAALGTPSAGTLLGSLTTGDLVTPDTVRRWACDASIIPTVLNSRGEVVDLGRATRLFTPAQVKRLWLRDRHCTYPGCDVPGAWTDAHHLTHWADGGASDLTNAALLCQRHHTLVHSRRLHGHLTTDERGRQHVSWDLTRGSYDAALAHRDTGPCQRVSGDDTTWHRP